MVMSSCPCGKGFCHAHWAKEDNGKNDKYIISNVAKAKKKWCINF